MLQDKKKTTCLACMPGPLHSFLFTLPIVHLYRCLSCDMKDASGQHIATKPCFLKKIVPSQFIRETYKLLQLRYIK